MLNSSVGFHLKTMGTYNIRLIPHNHFCINIGFKIKTFRTIRYFSSQNTFLFLFCFRGFPECITANSNSLLPLNYKQNIFRHRKKYVVLVDAFTTIWLRNHYSKLKTTTNNWRVFRMVVSSYTVNKNFTHISKFFVGLLIGMYSLRILFAICSSNPVSLVIRTCITRCKVDLQFPGASSFCYFIKISLNIVEVSRFITGTLFLTNSLRTKILRYY